MRKILDVLVVAVLLAAIYLGIDAFIDSARAQTAPAASTGVDYQSALNDLVKLLVVVIVGVIARLVQRYVGVTIDANHKDTLEVAMTNGIALALSKVGSKNDQVVAAKQYVVEHADAAVKHFGLDKDPDKLAEKIEARIAANVQAAMAPPAAQGATT